MRIPVLNSLAGVLIIFLLMSCGLASATISYNTHNAYSPASNEYNNMILVNGEITNLSVIETAINNPEVLRHSGTTWYLNSSLYVYEGSEVYINDTICTDLILGNQVHDGARYGVGGFSRGSVYLDGVNISVWNYTSNSVPNAFASDFVYTDQFEINIDDAGSIENCNFEGVRRIYLLEVHDSTVNNIKMNNSYNNFCLFNCYNMNCYNFTMTNMSKGSPFYEYGGPTTSHDNHIRNLVSNSTGMLDFGGGFEGVILSGNNSTMDTIIVNNTGYQGVEVDSAANNCSVKNVTVRNAWHNGMDIHGASNLLIDNISVYESGSNNLFITGSGGIGDTSWNITMRNAYAYHSGWQDGGRTGIRIGGAGGSYGVRNVTLENVTSDTENNGLELSECTNITVKNFTTDNCNYSYKSGYNNLDVKILDSDVTGSNNYDVQTYSGDTDLINTKFSSVDRQAGNYTTWYYHNTVVKNSNLQPVVNAILTANNTMKNRNGVTTVSGATINTGRLSIDGLLAIPDIKVDNSGTTSYITRITTTKSGKTNSTVVNPDSSYYSPDLSSLQGEEKVLILDVPVLDANFTATPLSGVATMFVQFTDTSTGSPTSWLWNFGDGSTSTLKNTSHTYADAGTYTVSLTVTDSEGNSTETKTDYITVTGAVYAPVANFTANATSGDLPLCVAFTDSSTNTPTSWIWNFGDGNTSTDQNPTHIYSTEGSYTVTLTASNAAGSNTLVRSGCISAGTSPNYSWEYLMWWLRVHGNWFGVGIPLMEAV